MKELIFGEGLLNPTLSGDQMNTLRKYRLEAHSFLKGEYILGQFPAEGIQLVLQATADTRKFLMSDFSDEEAQANGYKDSKDAYRSLKRSYYQDLKWISTMAIIEFEVARIGGVPAISVIKR